MVKLYKNRKNRRKVRVRSKIRGSADVPRVSVFRSNKQTYVQIIDDESGKTILAGDTRQLKDAKGTKLELAIRLGEEVGKKMKKKGIKKAVFDRGAYKYHGRVQGVADGIKSSGVKV